MAEQTAPGNFCSHRTAFKMKQRTNRDGLRGRASGLANRPEGATISEVFELLSFVLKEPDVEGYQLLRVTVPGKIASGTTECRIHLSEDRVIEGYGLNEQAAILKACIATLAEPVVS